MALHHGAGLLCPSYNLHNLACPCPFPPNLLTAPRSYFDEEAQKCSRALKDGTIITAKLDMFYVAAARKEPQVLGGLDDSCRALYGFGGGGGGGQGGMRGAGSTPDMISQMEAKMRGMLNAEGVKADTEGYGYRDHDGPYYRHHDRDYSGPDADPSAGTVLVNGTAILLAGPITSITNMKHATEYKQGLMQFVPIFVPFPVINGSAALPLNSRPLVKPNSYKVWMQYVRVARVANLAPYGSGVGGY
jgi:hypothetical protein